MKWLCRSHKFSRERLLVWSWQFMEYWLSEKALEYVNVSRGVSYKEKIESLQVAWNDTKWLGTKKKNTRWRDESGDGGEGQKGVSVAHLAPCTKLSDPSEVDAQKTNLERWINEEGERKARKGKEGQSKGKERFTESWRVNQKHLKRKEPRFLPLSSRSWEPQYICICLLIFG